MSYHSRAKEFTWNFLRPDPKDSYIMCFRVKNLGENIYNKGTRGIQTKQMIPSWLCWCMMAMAECVSIPWALESQSPWRGTRKTPLHSHRTQKLHQNDWDSSIHRLEHPGHIIDAHKTMPTAWKRNMGEAEAVGTFWKLSGNMLSLSEQDSHEIYCVDSKCLITATNWWYLILIGWKMKWCSSTTTTRC